MAKRGRRTDSEQLRKLRFRFNERLAYEHFGSHKYATAEAALRELVANAFDAEAITARVSLEENDALGLEAVTVVDDGQGMTLDEIEERFVEIGVPPAPDQAQKRLGRFGVGRFAVHRIGRTSAWTTMSRLANEPKVISFTLADGDKQLAVELRPSRPKDHHGTSIRITAVREGTLTPNSIEGDLAAHFCAYLLAHPNQSIYVQGRKLDVKAMIEEESREQLAATHECGAAKIRHVLFRAPANIDRIGGQIVYTVKGRAVTATSAPHAPHNRYLALVESAVIDRLVMESRTDLLQLDNEFTKLRLRVEEAVGEFTRQWRESRSAQFLTEARQEPYYPFRSPPKGPVEEVQQEVYDLTLEKLNERANVRSMTAVQKQVVFKLLDRALVNQDVFEVLSEVAGLSDQEMEKFRKVLERVTLQSIVRMTSVVTERLEFLEVLQQLVYGKEAQYLK